MISLILAAVLAPPAAAQDEEAKAKAAVAAFDKGGGKSKQGIEVCNAMVTHLSPVRHPLVLNRLLDLLKHSSVRVRGDAMYLVARYPESAAARTALLEALAKDSRKAVVDKYGNDSEQAMSVAIITALADFKPAPEMTEPLLKALRHDCSSIRRSAATTCGRLKLLDAVEPLIAEFTKIEAITAEPLKDERDGGPKADKLTPAQIKQKVENRQKTEAGPAMKAALQILLGTKAESAAEFAAYWKENGEALRGSKK